MPLTDPIGDLITRMRNAQHGGRSDCRAQWSKIKQAICDLMKQQGYLETVTVEGEEAKKELVVTFRTDRPALLLKRISTPGGRKYVGSGDIRSHLHGSSMAILSTSTGLVTHKEARLKNIGGEILCTVS
ncbi:30S ribosomal protein S8 [Candidatus Peribacteria bacterium]|nr:30S ribosomal protein S8 [Candidatus Peribacteria bacterium]